MYEISLRGISLSCVLLLISLVLWTNVMGMLRPHQAFAQNSINLANLLVGGAIQAFNHKDVNGTLQNLKLIGIANKPSSCIASTLAIQTLSKGPNPNNPSFGVVPTSAIQTFSKMLPNQNPNNPSSGVVPTSHACHPDDTLSGSDSQYEYQIIERFTNLEKL